MTISNQVLASFAAYLRQEDRAPGTVSKYLRDAAGFAAWLGQRELDRENAAGWKEHLLRQGCAPATVNSMLSAVNCLLRFLGREDCSRPGGFCLRDESSGRFSENTPFQLGG